MKKKNLESESWHNINITSLDLLLKESQRPNLLVSNEMGQLRLRHIEQISSYQTFTRLISLLSAWIIVLMDDCSRELLFACISHQIQMFNASGTSNKA